jgi:hypothetical protein
VPRVFRVKKILYTLNNFIGTSVELTTRPLGYKSDIIDEAEGGEIVISETEVPRRNG